MSVNTEAILCPVIVGREAELATLQVALDAAMQGQSRALFLSGEAGIGKSRLCRAIVQHARQYGLVPLVGLGSPQETSLPYGLIVDALRRAFAQAGSASASLQNDLALLMPVLTPLLPEFGPAVAMQPQDPPASQRRRLFEALSQTLRRLAQRLADQPAAPLVLILEDLHWADESTLDLLEFLLRTVDTLPHDDKYSGRGLLVIGTFRSEELSGSSALSRLLAQLLASRLARLLELRPLTTPEMQNLLEEAMGHTLPGAFIDALSARSEGNPFIAEELLGALNAAGHLVGSEQQSWQGGIVATVHLPLSLRSAVLGRLTSLSVGARTLLTAAAVAGRTFDVDLLAEVTALDSASLREALRLLLQSTLLEEERLGRLSRGNLYRFRHALTREVIYDDLLGPERRDLHIAIAHALEARLHLPSHSLTEGEQVQALAYHFRLAGDDARAYTYTLRAAERSRALLSFAEARRHYDEALGYLPLHSAERLPLVEALGLLSIALLDIHGAVGYFEEATSLLRWLGLPRKAASVAGAMHHLFWYIDLARFHTMVGEMEEMAETAFTNRDGAGPDDGDALSIYAATSLAHAVYAQYARANLWAQRALDLAQRLEEQGALDHDTAALASYKALLARGHARVHGYIGDTEREDETVEAGLRDEQATLELGLRLGQPEIVQLAYNFMPRGLLEVGHDAATLAQLDAADSYAQRSGVVTIADTRGFALLAAGRWEEAGRILREAIAGSRAMGTSAKLALELTALGHLLLNRGQLEGAEQTLHEALHILEPGGQFVLLAPCFTGLARVRARHGDAAGASALFNRGHALWQTTEDRGTVLLLLLEATLFFAAQGDENSARRWVADLQRATGTHPVSTGAAMLAQAQGAVLLASGEHQAAIRHLTQAVDCWQQLARPYEVARARVLLATAILAAAPRDQKQRSAADALLGEALASFSQLDAALDHAEVEEIRQRAGLQAQDRRKQTLRQQRAPFGDLTPREREVLRLLVAGRTNKEIAQALFIVEGTVELHVSRILSKLGCTTRAQASAHAVAHGLVDLPS